MSVELFGVDPLTTGSDTATDAVTDTSELTDEEAEMMDIFEDNLFQMSRSTIDTFFENSDLIDPAMKGDVTAEEEE